MRKFLFRSFLYELLNEAFQICLFHYFHIIITNSKKSAFLSHFNPKISVQKLLTTILSHRHKIILMNLKKTEQFLYFQNKARHYANLKEAKSTVKTHRYSPNQSPREEYSKIPYFKRYELEVENQGLINRITEIVTGPRLEIEKQGYTRYNNHFVPKSHYTIEQKRNDYSIEEGNQYMARKVLRAKPSIGTIENWNKQFHANREIRSNISKYTERRTSKGTLDVYTSSTFVPSHYRSFLKGPAIKPEEQSPEQLSSNMKIRVQQLFQLPKLRKLRGSMTRIGENGAQVDNF